MSLLPWVFQTVGILSKNQSSGNQSKEHKQIVVQYQMVHNVCLFQRSYKTKIWDYGISQSAYVIGNKELRSKKNPEINSTRE